MAKSRKLDPPSDSNATAPADTNTATMTSPTESGNGEKPLPTFRVGPIPTDANSAVSCLVFENVATTSDGRTFKVHHVNVEATQRESDGHWRPMKGFRGSQLYALVYCLQKASDFILSQRDPANDCPF